MANNGSKENLNLEYLPKNLALVREISGKSLKEVSELLGIPGSRLKNYEKGKYTPSLPEIESLAFIYQIPRSAFFAEMKPGRIEAVPADDQLEKLIEIRQKIIGTKLNLAREQAEMTLKALSDCAGIPTSRIKRYEEGISPIPADELQKIAECLGISMTEFFDCESPIGRWQTNQDALKKFDLFDADQKQFLTDSDNQKVIELARALQSIGVEKLKELAISLLNFTNTLG